MAKGNVQSGTEDKLATKLRQAKGGLKDFLKSYQDILDLAPKSLKNIEVLDKILKHLPPPDSLARELKTLDDRMRELRRDLAAELEDRFRVAFTSFIRKEQEQEPAPREVGSSTWRIGRHGPAMHSPVTRQDRGVLDVHEDASRQRIRISYDGEEVVPWTAAASLEEIEGVVDGAYQQLEGWAIPKDQLPVIFAGAYEACARERRASGLTDPELVPVLEFLQQVRLEMDRQVLSRKGPGATLPYREFPMRALLYNLDRYQVLEHGQDGPPRLSLETGVQATIREGKCVLVSCHGQDRRMCCFIRKVAR